MQDDKHSVKCPGCGKMVPPGDVCPYCGHKLPIRLGSMTDEQLKRVRRPLTILCWVVIAAIVIFKYLV